MAWPQALNGKENIAHRSPIRINRLWVRRNRTEGAKDKYQSALFLSMVGASVHQYDVRCVQATRLYAMPLMRESKSVPLWFFSCEDHRAPALLSLPDRAGVARGDGSIDRLK